MKRTNGRPKVIIRTNVLILMGVAYAVIVGIFLMLVWGADNLSAEAAWNILEGPLMALIGGTLAISKDLVSDDSSASDKNSNKIIDSPEQQSNQERAGEEQK